MIFTNSIKIEDLFFSETKKTPYYILERYFFSWILTIYIRKNEVKGEICMGSSDITIEKFPVYFFKALIVSEFQINFPKKVSDTIKKFVNRTFWS